MYALTRDWSSLYSTMRSESETAAQSSCSHFECICEHSGCLSSACIVLGAVNFTVMPAENFVSPLSLSPLPLRISIEKKKSQCRRTTVSSSKRTFANPSWFILPPLDSAFDRLKTNSSRPSVRYHSCWRFGGMALASRLARSDNAVPSLPGSDSWLSKKKQKKIPELVPSPATV